MVAGDSGSRKLDQSHFEVVARAFLPYELRFVSEGRIENWRRGVIDARLSGDLEGFARWSIESVGGSCKLVYDQEVDANKALLKALAPVARPAFRMNHSLMMRNGQAGLRTFMAGYRIPSGQFSLEPGHPASGDTT